MSVYIVLHFGRTRYIRYYPNAVHVYIRLMSVTKHVPYRYCKEYIISVSEYMRNTV